MQQATRYSYPPQAVRLHHDIRKMSGRAFAVCVGILIACGVGVLVSDIPVAALGAVGFFALAVGLPSGYSWREPFSLRVVPFFAHRVETVFTFIYGKALARNVGAVDDHARLLGVVSLSDFGYHETAPLFDADIWHDAADCLPTLAALVAAFEENGLLLGATETPEVLADLKRLQTAMQDASKQNTPFRLLLRYHDHYFPSEPVFDHGYF